MTFGKKVVVLEVSKEGNAWQNFFNCYNRVVTSLDYTVGDVSYVTLDCTGAGYNWCRASREIGATYVNLEGNDILGNAQIISSINSLLNISELAAQSGSTQGTSSQKVCILNGSQTQIYFVKAVWRYDPKNLSKGNVTITIETDDSNLMNVRTRQ